MTYVHYARYVRYDADSSDFEEGIARIVTARPEPPSSEQYARRIPRFVKAEYLGSDAKETTT